MVKCEETKESRVDFVLLNHRPYIEKVRVESFKQAIERQQDEF